MTSFAKSMAPAQVPNVGFTRTNSFNFANPAVAQDLQKRARLAAWNYEPIDLVELFWLSNLDNFGAELLEPSTVRVEISLNCQYADFHDESKTHSSSARGYSLTGA